jgi:hypothetical protein
MKSFSTFVPGASPLPGLTWRQAILILPRRTRRARRKGKKNFSSMCFLSHFMIYFLAIFNFLLLFFFILFVFFVYFVVQTFKMRIPNIFPVIFILELWNGDWWNAGTFSPLSLIIPIAEIFSYLHDLPEVIGIMICHQ